MPTKLLTEEHLESLKIGLGQATEIEGELARAEQAGIDVKAQRDRLAANVTKIRNIMQSFFPGR